MLSAAPAGFGGLKAVFPVTDKGFFVSDKVLSASEKVFSVLDKPFFALDKTFSVSDKGFSMTDKGLSVTNKGFSKPDKGLSVTDKGLSKTEKVMFLTDLTLLWRQKPVFDPKTAFGMAETGFSAGQNESLVKKRQSGHGAIGIQAGPAEAGTPNPGRSRA